MPFKQEDRLDLEPKNLFLRWLVVEFRIKSEKIIDRARSSGYKNEFEFSKSFTRLLRAVSSTRQSN